MALGPLTFEGAGCLDSSGLAATMTRLSPASPAAEDLPVQTEGPIMPVTDPVQLEGLWLLRGAAARCGHDRRPGRIRHGRRR